MFGLDRTLAMYSVVGEHPGGLSPGDAEAAMVCVVNLVHPYHSLLWISHSL